MRCVGQFIQIFLYFSSSRIQFFPCSVHTKKDPTFVGSFWVKSWMVVLEVELDGKGPTLSVQVSTALVVDVFSAIVR